jgi:hypothetical protein
MMVTGCEQNVDLWCWKRILVDCKTLNGPNLHHDHLPPHLNEKCQRDGSGRPESTRRLVEVAIWSTVSSLVVYVDRTGDRPIW